MVSTVGEPRDQFNSTQFDEVAAAAAAACVAVKAPLSSYALGLLVSPNADVKILSTNTKFCGFDAG
jgi:hypothetical protein